MTALIAILVLVALFTLFGLLGPAERGRSCGGRGALEKPCRGCPRGLLPGVKRGDWSGCAGASPAKNGGDGRVPMANRPR